MLKGEKKSGCPRQEKKIERDGEGKKEREREKERLRDREGDGKGFTLCTCLHFPRLRLIRLFTPINKILSPQPIRVIAGYGATRDRVTK